MRPPRDDSKVFSYLLPAELLALLACVAVPLGRRVLYALAVYTGLRLDSLLSLRWRDLDLAHGTIAALVQKNGVPQLFALELPGLAAVLRAWRERVPHEGAAPVVPTLSTTDTTKIAGVLRADLQRAGVEREVLFTKDDPRIEPLRFHDLRSTFVTWAKRAGKGDGWISDRTGHHSPTMLARYTRAARTLADLAIEPFPDLTNALPDLADWPTNGPRGDGGEGDGEADEAEASPDSAVILASTEGGTRTHKLFRVADFECCDACSQSRFPAVIDGSDPPDCQRSTAAKYAEGPTSGPRITGIPTALAALVEEVAARPDMARSLLRFASARGAS